jgi:DNA-binding MarR family transcriptional regulator
MEEAGFVRRAPDPEDGRGTLVSLTKKGERYLEPVFKENIEAHEEIFHDLSKADRERIATALRDLLDAFEGGR